MTPNLWVNQGTNYTFLTGDQVVFNDTGSANPAVNLQATVVPTSLLVSNAANHYSFSGAGSIGGFTALTKTNSGTLTILNTNTYTGPTVVGGGVVEVAASLPVGSPSPLGLTTADPGNLVFYDAIFCDTILQFVRSLRETWLGPSDPSAAFVGVTA